jgi:hypothetical protein
MISPTINKETTDLMTSRGQVRKKPKKINHEMISPVIGLRGMTSSKVKKQIRSEKSGVKALSRGRRLVKNIAGNGGTFGSKLANS